LKDNAACAARRSVTRAAGPLQYVLRDDEYLVYSVGSNRIDEGGLIAQDRVEGDHAFRVGRAFEADVGTDEYPDEKGMADAPD